MGKPPTLAGSSSFYRRATSARAASRTPAVDKALPDFPRLASLLRSLDGEGCYLFTLDTERDDSIAQARFFNPTLGIFEDAATGTAAGPLACQLVAHQLAKDGSTLQIEQGYAMGRPSLIRVHVSGTAVQVSGSAVHLRQRQPSRRIALSHFKSSDGGTDAPSGKDGCS